MFDHKSGKPLQKMADNVQILEDLFSVSSKEIKKSFIVPHSNLPVVYYVFKCTKSIFVIEYFLKDQMIMQYINEIEISENKINLKDALSIYLDARNNKNANEIIDELLYF